MPPIAAPADKRFRRAHVKPARRGKVSARHAWRVFKVITVLALAVYGGWRGTVLVLGAPALQVTRIAVRGNERLSAGEVLALVDGLRGQSILTVDLDEWQQRLLASSWVEEAHVRRVLPSGVDIRLHERRAIGIGRLAGALYLIDATGVVIDEYGVDYSELDLPIIDGLAARPADGASAVDQTRARLAARVIASLESRPELADRVSLIDVSDAHDAVVMLEGDTVMLRLGEEDFAGRIQEYLDLAPALRERVSDIDYVDLRFDERLYVRPVSKR
ncbi:MAG TPA: FtsQ-type POTRA domain-containing protein [Vicinamibacterales bacterium]|nr:FtsQ-type POTRA domain-containing protein [Vicinamibacterales bacterium]